MNSDAGLQDITCEMLRAVIHISEDLKTDIYGAAMHKEFLEWLEDVEKRDPLRVRDVLKFITGSIFYPPRHGHINIRYVAKDPRGGILPYAAICGSLLYMYYGFPPAKMTNWKESVWDYFETYISTKVDGDSVDYG